MCDPKVDHNVYKHFKGGLYKVLGIALDSETQEPTVIYIALKDGGMWTRKAAMWGEPVEWPDGVTRPRFTRLEQAP